MDNLNAKNPLLGKKYRSDIDGLRAIAVLVIVIYHAFPSALVGGFIGVDIFFVISGYLISRIIFTRLNENNFDFLEFYSRRIRRIFPALLMILIVSFVVGWFVMLGDEYKQLGKHIAGGAGFISNFIFWSESGYFDTAAETKPLLHLWSLGIEEQFYIIWPLFLWLAWRNKSHHFLLLLAVTILSFSLNVLNFATPTTMFYSPQTRFWELLSGSLLAYNSLFGFKKSALGTNKSTRSTKSAQKAYANAISLLGLILIILSLLIINKERIFPGLWALLPTLGALMIISAGTKAWLNSSLLSHRVLVWFGLISYPLYLWHWPIFTFTRIIQSGEPSLLTKISALITSVILAWMTYIFLEKPIRYGSKNIKYAPFLLLFMTGILIIGIGSYMLDGIPGRKVVQLNPGMDTQWDGRDRGVLTGGCGIENDQQRRLFAECSQDSRNTPRYAILGDSKATALFRGVVRTSDEKGRWLCIGGNGPNGAPAPIISNEKIYAEHQKLTRIAMQALIENKNIDIVVLVVASRTLFKLKTDSSIESLPQSEHFEAAHEGLNIAIQKLVQAGKKVILVVDNPTLPDPKNCIARRTSSQMLNKLLLNDKSGRCQIALDRHLQLSQNYRKLLTEIAANDPQNIVVFDTLKYLCETDPAVCRSYKNGRLLYSYTDHISDYAAGLIGKELNAFLHTLETTPET